MNGSRAGAYAWPGSDNLEVGNTPEVGEAILVVDGDRGARSHLEAGLRHGGARVWSAGDADEARALTERHRIDLVIADIDFPDPTSGLDLARQLLDLCSDGMSLIFLTGASDLDAIGGALQDDGADLLRKVFRFEQLLTLIKRIRDRRLAERENYLLQREADRRPAAERMIGDSEAIREVRGIISRIAPMPSTVLLKGETGTGKELAARALHDLSGRRRSYVPLNCAAISPELFEGELFGHAKAIARSQLRRAEARLGWAGPAARRPPRRAGCGRFHRRIW
jgi:DNA-binding NtrC family response regulator